MSVPTLIYGSNYFPRFTLLPVGENPENKGDMVAQVNEIPRQQRGLKHSYCTTVFSQKEHLFDSKLEMGSNQTVN